MDKNDAVIFDLKKKIEEKKKALKATEKFTPHTNCSLELDGARVNLHTLTKDSIVALLVKLNAYRLSAKDLGLLEDFKVSGYSVGEWIKDLQCKLMNVNRTVEEARLKAMEAKLHNLLSHDTKVELELNEIAGSLE